MRISVVWAWLGLKAMALACQNRRPGQTGGLGLGPA